jgi:hypothetical protein
MKTLVKSRKELQTAGRWDIDYHLPAEGITKFPKSLLKRVDKVADVVRDKRDPSKVPDAVFQYIDISAVDVSVGTIANVQDLEGSEAPSRARKVVRAFDLVVSTCRPTRGAIAIVPVHLHNQIASTGFSVVRAHENVNPFYLHYAMRLPSTLEQMRKWSTGSSYPAILDADVKKTIIPMPSPAIQDAIAAKLMASFHQRSKALREANAVWARTLNEITNELGCQDAGLVANAEGNEDFDAFLLSDVQKILKALPALTVDNNGGDDQDDLLTIEDDAFDLSALRAKEVA